LKGDAGKRTSPIAESSRFRFLTLRRALAAMPTIPLNRWCRFFLTSKLLPGVAMKRSPALRHDRQQAVRLGDGFAVVSAGEALETDEVAIVADNAGPIICHPRYPQRWIEQITKAGREQLACVGVALARAEAEESAMPVLIMWAVPAVIVIGGVGYFLVRAVH
jgi:hypothetical protein